MAVHELIESLFAAGDWGNTARISSLEAKIRAAVIEEASVGAGATEIPAGKTCEGCAYLDWDNDDTVDIKTCILFEGVWAVDVYPQRGAECLSVYPNGATVMIVPRVTA